MDADSLADFNSAKADTLLDLAPATIAFADTPSTSFEVSFSEVRAEPALHDYGTATQHYRRGALYFPAPYADGVNTATLPRFGQVFTITEIGPKSQHLVNTRWQVDRLVTGAHEAVIKYECHKLT